MQNAECARMFAFSAQAAGAVSKQPFPLLFSGAEREGPSPLPYNLPRCLDKIRRGSI